MKLADKVIVVTGAASGIGQAMCRRFSAEGAAGIVAADLNAEGARATAAEVGGLGIGVDVSSEADVQALCAKAIDRYGRIDVFCSNAGVISRRSEKAPDADWMRAWGVNVMAHVYGSRAVLPHMLARGDGYLLHTASAAGLVTQVDAAPYAVTKHAAVAFAEWLSIAYGEQGIRVSVLCPQGVRTPMLRFERDERGSWLDKGSVSAEQVAEAVVRGLEAERFLILPHPEVVEFFRRKSADYDRWIRGMRRFRADIMKGYGREDA